MMNLCMFKYIGFLLCIMHVCIMHSMFYIELCIFKYITSHYCYVQEYKYCENVQ